MSDTMELSRPTQTSTRSRVKPRRRGGRVDWFRVIVDLERHGYSQRDLAALADRSQMWLQHLKNSPGAEPRFDDGMLLLDIWGEAMDKPLSEAPRDRPSINRPI